MSTRKLKATMPESHALDVVLRSLKAIEAGVTGAELGRHYADDVIVEEMPNRLNPAGARHDKAALLAAAEQRKTTMTGQKYEVIDAVADGDRIALEVAWSATLAVPLGKLAAGEKLTARFAIFAHVRDGRVAAQRNYGCLQE